MLYPSSIEENVCFSWSDFKGNGDWWIALELRDVGSVYDHFMRFTVRDGRIWGEHQLTCGQHRLSAIPRMEQCSSVVIKQSYDQSSDSNSIASTAGKP
jgi:hypothetical protein